MDVFTHVEPMYAIVGNYTDYNVSTSSTHFVPLLCPQFVPLASQLHFQHLVASQLHASGRRAHEIHVRPGFWPEVAWTTLQEVPYIKGIAAGGGEEYSPLHN